MVTVRARQAMHLPYDALPDKVVLPASNIASSITLPATTPSPLPPPSISSTSKEGEFYGVRRAYRYRSQVSDVHKEEPKFSDPMMFLQLQMFM